MGMRLRWRRRRRMRRMRRGKGDRAAVIYRRRLIEAGAPACGSRSRIFIHTSPSSSNAWTARSDPLDHQN